MPEKMRRLFWALLLVMLLLLLLYPLSLGGGVLSYYSNYFDLDGEYNVPAVFSAGLLLLVALSCLFGQNCVPSVQDKNLKRFLVLFGLIYLFLACDELCGIHERLGQWLKMKWLIVYLPFIIVIGAFLLNWLWLNRRRYGRLFRYVAAGMAAAFCGSFFCEALASLLYPLPGFWRQLEYMVEEGLEMGGSLLVLDGIWGLIFSGAIQSAEPVIASSANPFPPESGRPDRES